jgi:hypothetical protein
MLNPWLSLSFQAARLGLEAQNAVLAGFFRMASGNPSNPSQMIGVSDATAPVKETHATASSPQIAARAVAQKAEKIHRKASRGRKRRHSK